MYGSEDVNVDPSDLNSLCFTLWTTNVGVKKCSALFDGAGLGFSDPKECHVVAGLDTLILL